MKNSKNREAVAGNSQNRGRGDRKSQNGLNKFNM